MQKTSVFYAGCFDPFTNGHLDVIKQALERFDKVILGFGISEKKQRLFNREQMITATQLALESENIQDKVLCVAYNNYTGEQALELGCACLIRGIKNLEEFEYEKYLLRYNLEHYKLNTLFFLPSRKDLEIVSSTYAKELYHTGDIKTLKKVLPQAIFKHIRNLN
jgi:pantetheine-phosphate adenylyltransferase